MRESELCSKAPFVVFWKRSARGSRVARCAGEHRSSSASSKSVSCKALKSAPAASSTCSKVAHAAAASTGHSLQHRETLVGLLRTASVAYDDARGPQRVCCELVECGDLLRSDEIEIRIRGDI